MDESQAINGTKKVSSKRKISIVDDTKAEVSGEEPVERIVKLSENNSDPLEYFSRFLDIPEMILNHLNAKDLLKISEVSQSYYNFIASSKFLMEKIKVVFDNKRELLEEDQNLLKNSPRLYQCIEVRRDSILVQQDLFLSILRAIWEKIPPKNLITKQEFKFFFKKTREWKEIRFVNIEFKNELDLWELLSLIQPTVERLSLLRIGFRENSKLNFPRPSMISIYDSWQFPKLKQLKLKLFSFGSSVFSILTHAVAVETLDVEGVDEEVSMKMLKNFDRLTSLRFKPNHNQIIKIDDWNEFKFKLKIFTLHFDPAPRNSIGKFSFPQSDHLNELTRLTVFGPGFDMESFNLIMKLPKLKSLVIENFQALSDNEANFGDSSKISSSIIDLTIGHWNNMECFKFLLNSMPNIERLQIYSINQEIFQTLVSMKKKFKELNFYAPKNPLLGIDQEALKEICDNITFILKK